jgi:hypothetical protein
MSNGAECCALGICCPPSEQEAALIRILVRDTHVKDYDAEQCAKAVLTHFTLAPKAFDAVIADIVARARAHFDADGV